MNLVKKISVLGISGALAFSAPSVSKADLIAYWSFYEGTGTLVHDGTLNGNIGHLQGGVSWIADGRYGEALHFNGIDGRVDVPKTPSMDLTNQVRLEAWIKRASSQDGTIISRNGPFSLGVKNNKVYGGVHTDGGAEGWVYASGTNSLQLNQWYHLAMSYDQSRVRVFVNEVEENSAPKSGIMVVRSQQPWIGWGEPGLDQYFHGSIDEVKVYDTAVVPKPSFESIAKTNSEVTLRVNLVNGQPYILESSLNLEVWSAVKDAIFLSNTNATEIIVPSQTADTKFYRLRESN